jgi:hypothetical protein
MFLSPFDNLISLLPLKLGHLLNKTSQLSAKAALQGPQVHGGAIQQGTGGAEEGRDGTFQPATRGRTAGNERGQSGGKLGEAFPGEQGQVQTLRRRRRVCDWDHVWGGDGDDKCGVDELSASNGALPSMAGAGAARD